MHITFGGIIFLLSIILVIVAIILISRWRKTGSFKLSFSNPIEMIKGSPKDKSDNVVIISNGKIQSEYWEEERCQDYIPQLYRNNNREYYVLQKIENVYIPFYPNDATKYYSPDEWAQVLQMKANEELFKKRSNLFQHISVWAIVAGLAIVSVMMLIL